jgi:pimeloyl-ACP methyl ester carboxylesterase
MRIILSTLICILLAPPRAECQSIKEIEYVSAADNSRQPAMFYAPDAKDAVPLIVALHTWSANYKQDYHKPIAQWCVENGWAYIHPDFRGPSRRPEATGSRLVVEDIVSAVEYAKKTTAIDSSSIYLVGTSGGGYTALVMAGRRPNIWAGVSAWAPISDLNAWYGECKKANRGYYKDIAASCGGAPGDSPDVDRQYKSRSPLNYLENAKGVRLHINTGIFDGHKGSVPISHTLLAFNKVAEPEDRISEEDIRFFVEKAKVPAHLEMDISDPSHSEKKPLFRRSSAGATVTIFNGGHEIIHEAAISWIKNIHENRKAARPPSPGTSNSTAPSQ